jgi:aminopeptidase
MTMYTPSLRIQENYARVLVEFALNDGKGVKKGDVVYLVTPVSAKPLAIQVYKAILRRGAFPILNLIDDDFRLTRLQDASDGQLSFFPEKYYRGLADSIDHWIRILAEDDPMFLKRIPPSRIIRDNAAVRPFRRWLDKKEDQGTFSWTLCLYPTEGMAREAGLSLRDYWKEVEKACFLAERDPIAKWRQVFAQIQRILDRLNRMPIERLHVTAPGTDLWITLGEKRRWLGGSGRNIPSFEIFTSPDWRGTEGTIAFDLPLFRHGNLVKGITLDFHEGRITKATARTNGKFLREMISQKNADKIGEFSLTDRRFSRITRYMANTLYTENFGGDFGNTHLAVGNAYHDTYAGDPKSLTNKQFERLGFNESAEHTDIIATTDRRVEAILKDGRKTVIYAGGQFRV